MIVRCGLEADCFNDVVPHLEDASELGLVRLIQSGAKWKKSLREIGEERGDLRAKNLQANEASATERLTWRTAGESDDASARGNVARRNDLAGSWHGWLVGWLSKRYTEQMAGRRELNTGYPGWTCLSHHHQVSLRTH